MFFYTDLSRAADPCALPNAEVFHAKAGEWETYEGDRNEVGWYWHPCFPGCIPDGEAMGPFDTCAEAMADAREGNDDCGSHADDKEDFARGT